MIAAPTLFEIIMALWDQIIADRDEVLLDTEDGQTCTAIELPGGESYRGIYYETSSEEDKDFGIANTIKSKLWIPSTAKPHQSSTWRITLQDGSTVDATTKSFGERSGGLLCVHLEKTEVSKFAGNVFSGARR